MKIMSEAQTMGEVEHSQQPQKQLKLDQNWEVQLKLWTFHCQKDTDWCKLKAFGSGQVCALETCSAAW